MLSVWSNRPRYLHMGLFFAAYVMGCGFAQVLAIVPGITVSIWPPAGVFIATLILTPPYSWPWWILAGCAGEMFGQFVWFHSPLPAGLLIYVGNALCAVVGATLVNRACGRPCRLQTLQEVLVFVALGAGVAPLASATVGSATLAWFGIESQTFTSVWPLFWIGDATGILLVAPMVLIVIQHWRTKTELSAAQWTEAAVLGVIFLGAAALALGGHLSSPYIIMPPLLWVAVRFEFRGAAVALTLLALITMALTMSGGSQFVGDPESQREQQVMLQLFLVISAFSALIVAAISRQHQQAVLTLRQSLEALRDRELELSQLVNMVPSHVWRLTPDGQPTFFNKRMVDFLGLNVVDTDKPGMRRLEAVLETIHPDDAPGFGAALRNCLATGESFAMRYRLRRADGDFRWMSSRAEPMRNAEGTIVQWNIICVDIGDEVRSQEKLRLAQESLARASQAASLAELSASIAHEVNQPLAAIVANSNACYRWLSAEPVNVGRAKITTERIIRDANSAAAVVSRIRALFKPSVEQRHGMVLSSAITEACNLLADEAARRRVRMDINVESNLPAVSADRVQIQQVLVNLIRNGMEAMDSVAGDSVLGVRIRRVGDEIRTEISDGGGGVEFPDRIFEPFFTTKEQGMGMGLAICRSIVESHGGRLWAENNEPDGATFICTLPIATNAVP
ncbi:MAG: MASE1 domain-containing protein [Phyllobacterium sp.]|uniref:MASE1 domain-containing protein n=1 Tax=Phyllobacterium sp. TaxID=1871046 RepID=UPI0030EFCCA1